MTKLNFKEFAQITSEAQEKPDEDDSTTSSDPQLTYLLRQKESIEKRIEARKKQLEIQKAHTTPTSVT